MTDGCGVDRLGGMMTGRLEIARREPGHRCDPPGPMLPPRSADVPAGSRWFCDCGQVWIARQVKPPRGGMRATVSHAEWFLESWRERRRRMKGRERLVASDRQPQPRLTTPPEKPKPPRGPSGISTRRRAVTGEKAER